LLALAVTWFLAVAPRLEFSLRAACAVAIVASAVSLGWLLEGKRHARAFEVARLLGIAGGILLVFPLV
jgi:hypothetical protein